MSDDILLDQLNTELRFEERVTRYLTVLRTGKDPVVFPESLREYEAYEKACALFREEVEHILTNNGGDH